MSDEQIGVGGEGQESTTSGEERTVADLFTSPIAEEPSAPEPTEQQPRPEQGKPEQKKVDLSQLPEFRSYQSKMDQQLAETQRRLQAYEQEMARLRQSEEQERLSGMDDYEQMEYRLRKAMEENSSLRNQFYQTQAEQAKQEGLRAISKQYGVPVDKLDDSSPEAAEASALRYQLEQLKAEKEKAQASPPPQTRQANAVDLGGGTPQSTEARYRAQLNKARDSNDARRYFEILEEARNEGIAI